MKHSMAVAYAMKKKMKSEPMADPVESQEDQSLHQYMAHGGDIVDHIMKKRQAMAEGGEVEADDMSSDFDVMDEEPLPESTNSGEADGDSLGNAAEDEDRSDIIARIMKSRSKKDKMPRPA